MALRTPPSWLQQGSHPAENDRLTTQAMFNNSGVKEAGDMKVTQSATPGMSVVVAAGWAAIVGTTTTNMGVYMSYNDGDVTQSIAPADATLPRIDRVVVTVNDAYYTGILNSVIFQVLTGTPNASPTAPGTPANSLSLATVAVAANATSITNANITDTRTRTAWYEFTAGTGSTTAVPLTVQLAASQTGDAVQIKNSAGVVLGYIDSTGTPGGTLAQGETFNAFLLMGA